MARSFQMLAEVAAAQHGLVRLTDLERCHITKSQLRTLLRTGWCTPVVRGIYRVASTPQTPDQALLSLVWLHPEPAVASHRSAARLWGLPGYEVQPPEITIRQGASRRGGTGVVRGSLWLPPTHLTTKGSIPVTNAARTLFDLAGVDRPGRVERAVDAAIHRRLCTADDIHRVFFALARRGRRGTTAMRAILEARGQEYIPPASELERRARRLFADAGLTIPEFEVDLGDEGWIGRVDCLWRDAKVIVELDGRRFHGGAMAHDADRRRDNRLMAAGWRVIRLTWDDICHHPERSVSLVRTALMPRPA